MNVIIVFTTLFALVMMIVIAIMRIKSAHKPTSKLKIILPPLFMSTGALMFIYPYFQLSRSEEHTSELQSRGHLVCRLPLVKKKFTGATLAPNVRDLVGAITPAQPPGTTIPTYKNGTKSDTQTTATWTRTTGARITTCRPIG